MTSFFATLGSQEVIAARVRVPWTGVWVADVDVAGTVVPSGQVTLQIGTTSFVGTVEPSRSGAFLSRTHVLVVGGKNKWSSSVRPRGYHNDAQVRRNQIAVDAARDAGEVLVVDAALDRPLNVDFAREGAPAPASRVLEQLFPDASWWVGTDGITRLGTRSITDVSANVQALEADERKGTAVLTVDTDDVSKLLPGSSVTDAQRLPGGAFVVHDVELVVEAQKLRAFAWAGVGRDERLTAALRALARESDSRRTFQGIYRYRVFSMSSDRVQLQAVRTDLGLPDIMPISMSPGVAGAWSELAGGSIVFVAFADGGDPAAPIVIGFEPKGGPGFMPMQTTLDAQQKVAIGASCDVDIAQALARLLRDGEKIQITGLVAPSSGGPVTCTPGATVISLDPVNLAPGAPGEGYSRAKG
jgi:hypothetical protein